jgi:multiple sugar transport system substrate-binding protein
MTGSGLAALVGIGVVTVGALVSSEVVVQRPEKPGRVVVIYWEKWTGSEGIEMQKTVDAFNRSQDHIFVRYLSIAGVDNKTLLATAGGDPPDVAGLWAGQVTQFSDAHALTNLKPMATAAGLTENYYIKSYWDQLNYRGGLWGLPSTPASVAMHVNVDKMPAAYRDPENFPKTIEDFDALVDGLNQKSGDGRLKLAGFVPSEPGWWQWAWGGWFGGKLIDGDRLTINSPENVKGFEWVRHFGASMGAQQMQDFQSGFGNFSSPQDAFMDGKVATELHGVYKANYIHLYNPKMHWFAVPVPYPKDRPDLAGHGIIDQDVLMIPLGAKHPKEAFEFIRYIQRQDVMESLCIRHAKNSPLAKVSENFFNHHPNPFIRLFDQIARSPNAISAPKIGISAQIGAEMSNVFQEVSLGHKTPKEALDEAQDRLDGEWKTYKEQVLHQQ